MKLIVGLGNPGREYEKTRHNSGFMAIDKLAERCGASFSKSKWKAMTAVVRIDGQPVMLMKPLTYMNESGMAVIQAVNYYHIDPEDLMILHDDMDLPVGTVRIRPKGSSGGQKGMKSIFQHLGTQDIARVRIGVGHSRYGNHDIVPDWVLSPVPEDEREIFEHALDVSAQAAWAWVSEPIDKVMSKYNIKEKKPERSNIEKEKQQNTTVADAGDGTESGSQKTGSE